MVDPRSLHGTIVLVGFLPMYIAAGFGVEFPVIGFPELDTTYESTGWARVSLLMMAATLLAAALSEIRGEMSIKTFTEYHWALSAALLTWQTGSTATQMGKMMFALPHLFTAWSTILYLTGSGDKSKSS